MSSTLYRRIATRYLRKIGEAYQFDASDLSVVNQRFRAFVKSLVQGWVLQSFSNPDWVDAHTTADEKVSVDFRWGDTTTNAKRILTIEAEEVLDAILPRIKTWGKGHGVDVNTDVASDVVRAVLVDVMNSTWAKVGLAKPNAADPNAVRVMFSVIRVIPSNDLSELDVVVQNSYNSYSYNQR